MEFKISGLKKLANLQKQMPDWLTYGLTVSCQKDRTKYNVVDKY